MRKIIVNSSLYGIGFGENQPEIFKNSEWVLAKAITPSLLCNIVHNKYRLIFLGDENIFSHEMNVLRKAILNCQNTRVLVGATDIFQEIERSSECQIDLVEDSITTNDTLFCFQRFDYYKESSELLEFDIHSNMICYKPDYFYNKELATLIAAGFKKAGLEMLDSPDFMPVIMSDGRIWCEGSMFPCEMMETLTSDKIAFLNNLLTYTNVLKKIYDKAIGIDTIDGIKELLVMHYAYSLLISYSLPYLTREVIEKEGSVQMESVYTVFAKNTPIQDKNKLAMLTLNKMNSYLDDIIVSHEYRKALCLMFNYDEDYYISVEDSLLFSANMISDLRRCVINTLIENNGWFGSICGHRKRSKLF